MPNSTTAIVVAAGSGNRFSGHYIPKQFLEISRKPILAFTLETMQTVEEVDDVVLVINRDYEQLYHDIIRSYDFRKIKAIVYGGSTRQESICAGLNAASDAEYVVVQNAVCPMTSPDTIRRVLSKSLETGQGASAYIEVVDSIVASQDGVMTHFLNRRELSKLQAPQAFPLKLIRDCHERAHNDGIHDVSNDAFLLERYGHKLFLVRGEFVNIKITTTEDWILANAVLGPSALWV
jgi:2-C-methyl-D-erythritol 4-phosphate cytidylyltransferase